MSATPNTSATSYLPVAELLKRKDWRTIADFCSDAGTRLTLVALATDPNVAALLLDASGIVESCALAGNAYQPADLAALVANGGAGCAFLFRLIADVFEGLMIERRPDKGKPVPPAFERAYEQLVLLRDGERIFSFQETQNAGQLQHNHDDVFERGIVREMDRFFGKGRAWGEYR